MRFSKTTRTLVTKSSVKCGKPKLALGLKQITNKREVSNQMMTVKKTEKMMMKATRTVSIKTKTKMMRVTIISDIRLIKAFEMFFCIESTYFI